MQKLIVLRGAPSSGKSTIALTLRNLKSRIVWLKVDNFKPFFGTNIFEENEAIDYVNQTAIAALKYLLTQGFSVIMEGIFQNPKYITLAIDVAKQNNIEFKVYELDCSLETLQSRDKTRPGIKEGCRKPLGDDVIKNLNQIIKDNPWNGAEKLNTEKLSLEKCIEVLNGFLSK